MGKHTEYPLTTTEARIYADHCRGIDLFEIGLAEGMTEASVTRVIDRIVDKLEAVAA
ncbi:hypothetical protein [Amycolatopsis acidicola]|uniref:hypothetical protein n=1 Tax=Amycolatopsis acidicola TaxID=2596893 RepID=UPI001407E040|nr:hypothetical protein [Amycolatopsis acidicola]